MMRDISMVRIDEHHPTNKQTSAYKHCTCLVIPKLYYRLSPDFALSIPMDRGVGN